MPFDNGTYVRFWDGGAVAYGQVVGRQESGYLIRIGGMDRVVEQPFSSVALHPTSVAMGRKIGPMDKYRYDPSNHDYLYHATSYDLCAAIIRSNHLTPRSRVNWSKLGDTVWQGAEKNAKRTYSAQVTEQGFFQELSALSSEGSSLLLGDVGEFFYAAKSSDDVLINYIQDIAKKGKSPVAFRFKPNSVRIAWYQDPKSTGAVMTMNIIPLQIMQVIYIKKKLSTIAGESELEEYLKDDFNWSSCTDIDWKSTIDLEHQLDGLS